MTPVHLVAIAVKTVATITIVHRVHNTITGGTYVNMTEQVVIECAMQAMTASIIRRIVMSKMGMNVFIADGDVTGVLRAHARYVTLDFTYIILYAKTVLPIAKYVWMTQTATYVLKAILYLV